MVDRVYQRNATETAPQPPTDPSEGYPTNGNPAEGLPATQPGAYWYHMITESLRRVVVEAGLTPDHEDLDQLLSAIKSTGQFADYNAGRIYTTGETCRGSDGVFYEFYDRDLAGTVQGFDPTNAANRPHVWMVWDGVRPGQTIEWRSEVLPEGYIENDGDDYSRADYRRIFAAFGTAYGAGDGANTFGVPDDRGEFKRGWDNGRGVDSGRVLAEHQMDQMQRITGTLAASAFTAAGNFTASGAFYNVGVVSGADAVSGNLNSRAAGFDSSLSPGARTGDSTRSRNNAVIYLTKI